MFLSQKTCLHKKLWIQNIASMKTCITECYFHVKFMCKISLFTQQGIIKKCCLTRTLIFSRFGLWEYLVTLITVNHNLRSQKSAMNSTSWQFTNNNALLMGNNYRILLDFLSMVTNTVELHYKWEWLRPFFKIKKSGLNFFFCCC